MICYNAAHVSPIKIWCPIWPQILLVTDVGAFVGVPKIGGTAEEHNHGRLPLDVAHYKVADAADRVILF